MMDLAKDVEYLGRWKNQFGSGLLMRYHIADRCPEGLPLELWQFGKGVV